MNFFEHQHQARRQTKRLVFYFILAIFAIVLLLNLAVFLGLCFSNIYCIPFSDYWRHELSWTISGGAVLIIVLTSLIRWGQMKRGGGFKAVKMAGARSVDLHSNDPKERQLINVVEEISIAAGIPVPNIYVMEQESAINAFVAGTEPHNTCLVVTRGCLDKLNRQELQGVIGHEYSHIFNGDMRLNIYLIGILAGILVIGQLGEFLMRSSSSSRSSRKNDGGLIALGLGIMVVGYLGLFFGRLIKAAISRQREFLADASAVQYTRDPNGIANALYKIKVDSSGSMLNTKSAEELSHMCFERSHKISFMSGLLATHPPIDQRIEQVAPNFVPPKIHSGSKQQEQTQQGNKDKSEAFVESVVLAGAISSQVGQIDVNQIDKTQWQLSLLPESLKQVARDTHAKLRASDLAFALLVLHNTLSRQQVIEQSNQWLDDSELERLVEILPDLSPLAIEQQLLLFDLALPRLKNYPEDKKAQVLNKAKRLVDCDRQVSLEEYIIYALLLLFLTEQKPVSKPITKYSYVENELEILIGTFVAHTATSHEKQTQTFTRLMQSFGVTLTEYQKQDFNPNNFHRALRKLACLNPLMKKPLIDSLGEAISSDGKLSAKQFMLMRAACEYLDCPLPKLL